MDEKFVKSYGDWNDDVTICMIIRLPDPKDSDPEHQFVCKREGAHSKIKNNNRLKADVPKDVLQQTEHFFVKFGVFKFSERKEPLGETAEKKVTKRDLDVRGYISYCFGVVNFEKNSESTDNRTQEQAPEEAGGRDPQLSNNGTGTDDAERQGDTQDGVSGGSQKTDKEPNPEITEEPDAKKRTSNDGVISDNEEDEQNWSPQSKNWKQSRELIFTLGVTHLEMFQDVNVGVALFPENTSNSFFQARYYLCEKVTSRSKSTNSYRVFLPKSQTKANQFFMKVFLMKKNVELLMENSLKESEEIRISDEEQRPASIDLGPIVLSEAKQSTDGGDVISAIDESFQEQQRLKTLKEVIKNESIDKYKPLEGGRVIEFNVIIGVDVIDPKAVSMKVAVSFPGWHQDFVEGFIAGETEDHMWIKFHIQPQPTAKELLYKYHLTKIMKNSHAPKTESETLEDSSVSFTRTLLLSDVSHTWFDEKFDGKIHFAGKKVTEEKSAFNSFLSFFTGSSDTINFKNQSWTGISIYIDLIFRTFVSTCETSTLVKSISSLLSSLGQIRWRTGNNATKEGRIDDVQLTNKALAEIKTLFDSQDEQYIDGRLARDTILFKFGVVLMVCYVEIIWPLIESKSLKTVLDLISFTGICDREEVASAISLLDFDLSDLCSALRECCADMLSEKGRKLTEHPVFMALIDWAYLDESETLFKEAHKLQISETFFKTCKPHCKSFASVRLLLSSALSCGIQNKLRENWELSLADVIACMMHLLRNNITLSMNLLTLSRNIVEEGGSLHQAKEHFFCLLKLLQFLPKYHSSQRGSINQMLHLCMDVLAAFECSFPEEKNSEEKEEFYAVFSQIVKKINVIGRNSMLEDDIFYWANLLRIRDGYSHMTIQFVNSDLKQLFFDYVRTTSGFSVPQYCMDLPNKVQQLRSAGRDIPSYTELQLAFDEALIKSLIGLIDKMSICENKSIQDLKKFILQVDNRPMVMEAFSQIVFEKFPVEIYDGALFETAMKLMKFPLTLTILELIRRENQATISRFSGIMPKLSTLFAEVARLLREGELTPFQLKAISQQRENFTLICCKLNIKGQKDIPHYFKKSDDALCIIMAKVKQNEKLLEFLGEIGSFGVEIDIGTTADFNEHWQEQPINNLVDFTLPSSSMRLLGESIEREDVILVEKYLALIESEIFSRIAEETLKTNLQKNELASFTLTDVLKTHLPQAEAKYIQQAAIVISGKLSVNEAKAIFKDCLDSGVSINEEMDIFAKFVHPTSNLRDVGRFNKDVALRKRQLSQLEQLTKNMEFNTCLKSILEMLQIGAVTNNRNLKFLSTLVRI